MHGGGYLSGSYDLDASELDRFVLATGCVAVSVGYRLSPETPYPGALDDCFSVLSFLAAGELRVDSTRLAVGGRSAGAGLAAALALRARDEGVPLVHQHLIYPMIDDSVAEPWNGWDDPVWPASVNAFAWHAYLGNRYRADDLPASAAPARATDLAGLPSTYIHVGARDTFLREGVALARGLLQADVPTELHVFPGPPHAFDALVPDAVVSRNAASTSNAALIRALGD
jgi:acetyl esterase/lipase